MIPAKHILTRIYHDLLLALEDTAHSDLGSNNLLQGAWGALLYLFYYEQYVDDTADNAVHYLERLYDRIHIGEEDDYCYSIGLSGPFWLLQHLQQYGLLDTDVEALISGFITGAIRRSRMDIQRGNVDFLGGSAGICYVLTSFSHHKKVREHLEEFAEGLARLAIDTGRGLSLPVFHYPAGVFSEEGRDAFGLAHGGCALRIILARIHGAGIAQATCERLIYGNTSFVLQHKNMQPGPVSLYPRIAGGPAPFSRLSWCYGDMGVAWSLWYCGRYFKEAAWQEEALAIMHHNAGRKKEGSTGIKDACLCHGAAGIATIYHTFWLETGEERFRDCAYHWYEQTSLLATFPGAGAAEKYGIKAWNSDRDNWQHCCNVLDGSAGAGLALLSGYAEAPLHWSGLLLL